jgi:hypothetical protein
MKQKPPAGEVINDVAAASDSPGELIIDGFGEQKTQTPFVGNYRILGRKTAGSGPQPAGRGSWQPKSAPPAWPVAAKQRKLKACDFHGLCESFSSVTPSCTWWWRWCFCL